MVQPLWKTLRRSFKNLKLELPYDPAIPLLGKHPDKTIIQKETCTPLFIAALFTIAKTCACVLRPQLCPTLCNPIDCSPPGSTVHGIFQARILEWIAISYSKGIMEKEIVSQVQEAQRVPYRKNPRRNTPRHIVIKLTKIKQCSPCCVCKN